MRFLVTGCAGFIGSHFVSRVLQNEENLVVGVDCLYPCASKKVVEPRARFVFCKGNINDTNLILNLLNEHAIDVVVHFAAQSHVDTSFSDMRSHVVDNTFGTFNVLEAVRQAQKKIRMVQVSTDEVFGENKTDDPHYEHSLLKPTSIYSASKAAAEMFCHAYVHSFGLDVVTVRGNNAYGKQYPEKLIPRFLSLLKQGKPLTIQGTGQQRRSFLYVDDFCDAIFVVLDKGLAGDIYNIGSQDELTVLEVARILADEMKVPLELQYVKDRDFNDARYLIHSGALEQLGWKQKTSFREGLREVIAFFQSDEANDYWVKDYDLPTPHLIASPERVELAQKTHLDENSCKRVKLTA